MDREFLVEVHSIRVDQIEAAPSPNELLHNVKDHYLLLLTSRLAVYTGMGGGSNSVKHYAKLMVKRINWGELSKVAPVAVAGFHSGPLQPNDESKYNALNFSVSCVLPIALKAVVELGVPDILAKADGGKPLSAPQILAKLPTKSTPGPNASTNLRRLMRPLAQQGFFTETLNSEKQHAYGLTEISKWYVRVDNELSLAPYPGFILCRPLIQAMCGRMHEVILDDDATPFAVEHGVPWYNFFQTNPELRVVFEQAMVSQTRADVKEVVDSLQNSGWLEGAKIFVDVAGGVAGDVVGEVVARNQHIQGINFDLPHVIEKSPEVKGVRFVGGDFFKAVPSGDVMFLKTTAHNYDDEECVSILKKCFEALPKDGKMIIAEFLVRDLDSSPKASFVAAVDVIMLGCFKGGRERTREEHQQLLEAAGFSQLSAIESQTGIDLVTGIKE